MISLLLFIYLFIVESEVIGIKIWTSQLSLGESWLDVTKFLGTIFYNNGFPRGSHPIPCFMAYFILKMDHGLQNKRYAIREDLKTENIN